MTPTLDKWDFLSRVETLEDFPLFASSSWEILKMLSCNRTQNVKRTRTEPTKMHDRKELDEESSSFENSLKSEMSRTNFVCKEFLLKTV